MIEPPIKLFDVVIHPRLEVSWIHFDIEATDENGKMYFDRSSASPGYQPPYPAFPCYAGKNYFKRKYSFEHTLEPFDINQIMRRLKSFEWQAGIKSIKFSNQVYVCPETYIVWESAHEQKEGIVHFEIKRLPKNRENIYVCREQNCDAWHHYNKGKELI
jgi:hypothetical protein